MQIQSVALSELNLDPSNVRKHDGKNLGAIKGSLAKFGQQKPIVVDAKGIILAGNGTYAAAKELGWDKIDVVRTELEGPEAIAYAIADNRSSELAEWDIAGLGKELEALDAIGFDLEAIGFDEDDLAKMLPEVVPEGLTDDDAVPEAVDTRCKPGDLWLLGNHRLLCGDSTDIQHVERLMGGEKADMVFTDPPYGMNLDTDFSSIKGTIPNKGGAKNTYRSVIGDDTEFDPRPYWSLFASAREQFWFGADYYCRAILYSQGSWIVWDKTLTESLDKSIGSNFELCWSMKKHKREIARIKWSGFYGMETQDTRSRVHPNQKPVQLAEWFFERWSKPEDLVADLFLGSGSTLIACEKTGRRCFGMEIDPHYCDVILTRWEQFTGKTAMLTAADAEHD